MKSRGKKSQNNFRLDDNDSESEDSDENGYDDDNDDDDDEDSDDDNQEGGFAQLKGQHDKKITQFSQLNHDKSSADYSTGRPG